MVDDRDSHYMARAIALAEKGLYTTDPNPRVGCVIVKDNEIIGEGWHQRAGSPHAEINALEGITEQARGATVYVSLEPCCHHGRTPPCTDALIAAQVKRVVIASLDPNPLVASQGVEQLKNAGIEVSYGVLDKEAEQLNPGFLKRMRHQLPYVRCKIAMSMDGRTAMASGESQWITGDVARADVHRWRARSTAIMTGIGTVLQDNPSLNARLTKPEIREYAFTDDHQPVRVVLDTHLRFPPDAKMLDLPGNVLIYTASNNEGDIRRLQECGAEVQQVDQDESGLQLDVVLKDLARRKVNELMIEAGATLNGALVSRSLVDEFIFYMAPSIMGDSAKGAFHLPAIHKMSDKIQLSVRETRQIGADWRIIAHLADQS